MCLKITVKKEGEYMSLASKRAEIEKLQSEIKIFAMNDCDWYAGRTAEEVEKKLQEDSDYNDDDWKLWGQSAKEIRKESYITMYVVRELDEGGTEEATFRTRLNEMIEEGAAFPCFFASTEY